MTGTRHGKLAGVRVLVVEDEFFLADDLGRALIDQGAQVIGPVGTVDRARMLANEQAIDLAVLDVNLKGEMIYPLAAELRIRGVPFVFTTGYDAAMVPPDYQDVPRWEKPFTTGKFIDALTALYPPDIDPC